MIDIFHVFIALCVVWTLISVLIGMVCLFESLAHRRPQLAPEPPTKPLAGRLPLPQVETKPYRQLRALDDGDGWWKEEPGEWAAYADNIIFFDPQERASYIAGLPEAMKGDGK